MSESRDLGRSDPTPPSGAVAAARPGWARRIRSLLAPSALLALACSAPAASPPAVVAEVKPPPSLLGEVSREQVEAAEPSWIEAQIEAAPDPAAVAELAAVPPGAEVTVYLGTWCSDSRRELGRFWRAADEAGGELPFAVRYIAVDRYPQRPPELEREIGLRYVPTFIVERDGVEVGRMVEVSPHGIESDLAALLSGVAEGVVSAREDLGASAAAIGH